MVEVVADDFIAVGYGNTFEEATQDHDKTLLEVLKRCEAKNVSLNSEKLKLRQSQVLFIGHMATDQGLEVDPVEMPPPHRQAWWATTSPSPPVGRHQAVKRLNAV